MACLTAALELVAAAETDSADIGSTINLANEAAALPTTEVLAAGAEEGHERKSDLSPYPRVREIR